MTEQLLNRANVVTAFQQVGGEGMAEGVEGGALRDAGAAGCGGYGALNHSLVQMVSHQLAGFGLMESGRGEEKLPGELTRGRRGLAGERGRQRDPAGVVVEIAISG